MTNLLIVRAGQQKELYQNLSKDLSGIEPPFWTALLAAFIREKGFKVKIVDAEIEPDKLESAIKTESPELIAIVVSGTNPSASTMNMVGARTILKSIKNIGRTLPVVLIGVHPSALPQQTLLKEPVDMVCEGEGFYTLLDLLSGIDYKNVLGLWRKKGHQIISSPRAKLVDPNTLPMPAWDLLPMHKYRAHNWHCFGRLNERDSYGIIYTSLGCPFSCSFCCINAMFGEHKIRYRDPRLVIKEIDYLVQNYGIRNIKIIDEMFDLNEEHVKEVLDLIIERKYNLNIWAYARVDTVSEKKLEKMKKAGIAWLCIGFESAVKSVRETIDKGRFDNNKIHETTRMIRNAGINIGANFIFGLPNDSMKTMHETLNLAKELNCEYANFYVAMAYPGSRLFKEAAPECLPESWKGYSQFGYETQPMSTQYLTASEILRFRDDAFNEYYSSEKYQNMILEKFGEKTLQHIKDMLKYKLRRQLLEEMVT